nr:hypothetical protein [Candidatus Njordarchaeota archaeon]
MFVDEIKYTLDDLDYGLIERNLTKYYHISKFLNPNWFAKMKRLNNKSHALLVLLSRPEPHEDRLRKHFEKMRDESASLEERATSEMLIRSEMSARNLLVLLDSMLSKIDGSEKGTSGLRTSLQNEAEF